MNDNELALKFKDPVFFIKNAIGWTPWDTQISIAQAINKHRRVTVKSCFASGKTKLAAGLCLWFNHMHYPSTVVTTAPTFAHLENVLWGEIRDQHKKMKERLASQGVELTSKCMQTKLVIDEATKHFSIGVSTDEIARISGYHNDHVLIIVDEAAGLDPVIGEALENLMTSENCKMLLIGNPPKFVDTTHRFYKSFYDKSFAPLFQHFTINALETPNVKLGREVIPGLVSKAWVEERENEWGKDSPEYQVQVLGEFPTTSNDQLFNPSDITQAVNCLMEVDEYAPRILAVDVAREGDDSSVFLKRIGNWVERDIVATNDKKLTDTIGRIIEIAKEFEPHVIVIDDVGLGGGVIDHLSDMYNCLGFNGGLKSENEQFLNLRMEYYWKLKEAFRLNKIAIPNDSRLTSDLSLIQREYKDDGRMKIISKNKMAKSPDFADALMFSQFGLDYMGYRETRRSFNAVHTPFATTSTSSTNTRYTRTGY